ncbi:MAG: 4'-phosphopantetheinyl transferase superfamily protein [bacterium]|nr:4'-phosphopantetheinyl transferase superfamily protein [bacterium]
MPLPNPFADHCVLAQIPIESSIVPLHSTEQALCASFGSAKRKAEFSTGRRAAARAMGLAGYPILPVGRGSRGEPLWPLGLVASLAHDRRTAACLMARRHSGLRAIGLDIEPLDRRPSLKALQSVCSAQELKNLQEPQSLQAAFCAKEAIFKAIYPLNQVALGFFDAKVQILQDGRFLAELALNPWPDQPGFPLKLQGKWGQSAEHLWAALALRNDLTWIE